MAEKNGLNIPKTYGFRNKKQLECYNQDNLITKYFQKSIFILNDKFSVQALTEPLSKEIIKELPDEFELSFVQERIDKYCDIRAFYLNGKFYSVAIFSQQNEKTKVDFRNYDKANPNRKVKFELPKTVQNKLKKLIKYYRYNTCSIDLVLNKDEIFYFLEINPVGQFSMISHPGNFYLKKKIAKELME